MKIYFKIYQDKPAYFDNEGFLCWVTPRNIQLMWDWIFDPNDQVVS